MKKNIFNEKNHSGKDKMPTSPNLRETDSNLIKFSMWTLTELIQIHRKVTYPPTCKMRGPLTPVTVCSQVIRRWCSSLFYSI